MKYQCVLWKIKHLNSISTTQTSDFVGGGDAPNEILPYWKDWL